MADDYIYKTVIYPILTACTAFGAAIMAFRPRLLRAEKDIQKLDKLKAETTQVTALETLMNTRFDAQGREIGEIKTGVNKLLERRNKPRDDD